MPDEEKQAVETLNREEEERVKEEAVIAGEEAREVATNEQAARNETEKVELQKRELSAEVVGRERLRHLMKKLHNQSLRATGKIAHTMKGVASKSLNATKGVASAGKRKLADGLARVRGFLRTGSPYEFWEVRSTELILMGLLIWLVEIFVFNFGTVSLINWLFIGLNLVAVALAVLVCHLPYKPVISVFVLQVFAIPYGLPYIKHWLIGPTINIGSDIPSAVINILTLPAAYPLWLLYAASYSKSKWTGRFYKMYIFFLVGLLAFAIIKTTGAGAVLPNAPEVTYDPQLIKRGFLEMWENLRSGWHNLLHGASQAWRAQINYATGGLYEARVDQGQKEEPLGVSLVNIKPISPEFTTSEEVVVWGVLTAHLMRINSTEGEESIDVKLSCYVKHGDNTINGTIIPDGIIRIYNDQEEDFECQFEPGTLEKGTQNVIIDVEYPFKTYSYLVRYFIDEAEYRQRFHKDDAEVFKASGITDTNPITQTTSGPVLLTLTTTKPLYGIYKNSENNMPIHLTMLIDKQWLGEIKRVKDIVLSLPPGLAVKKCYPGMEETGTDQSRKLYHLPEPIEENPNGMTINCGLTVEDASSLLGGNEFSLSIVSLRLNASYDYHFLSSTEVKMIPPPEEQDTQQ